ncbi:MAG: hypothetical protein HFH36_07045 [Lachnospiraceae bacterium]|nr:hypothetical protein [Lachnospiraceae bacterium]
MKEKVLAVIKEHKLMSAFLLAALIKQLLVIGLPIYVVSGSPCDDELLKDWAFSISRLKWLGDFGTYTFMKEPGFSFFLAVCYRLHIPYIFSITLGYSIACMIFCTALRKIFSGKSVFLLYIVLLFNPISFCCMVLQRVYRNGLGIVLTLFVFGGLLHMYFSLCEENRKKILRWSVFTGLSLGYLWITKSDTIWILPFTVTICAVMFAILLVKRRKAVDLPRYLCLAFPFLGIFLFSGTVKLCNILWYGHPSLEYAQAVIDDISHIKSGKLDEKISLSREQLQELYDICPTLAGVKDELEKTMDAYSGYDTRPEDGEVEDGWLGWALAEGVSNAGVYESCDKAYTFYEDLYGELEAAFRDGRLEKEQYGMAQKYYIDTPAHRRELLAGIGQVIDYMNSYQSAYAKGFTRRRWSGSGVEFELLSRNRAARNRKRYHHDYFASGWIAFPQFDTSSMDIYLEDKDGNRYTQALHESSKGISDYVRAIGYGNEAVNSCRFKAEWDSDMSSEDAQWRLNFCQDGVSLAKIPVVKEQTVEDENMNYTGAVDTFVCRREKEATDAARKRMVRRLNSVGNLYRAAGKPMFWLGILSYGMLTIFVVKDLRKKKYECLNAWLIATGFGLSVIVFAAGIASVELTQCPAINEMYLSSAYAILISAEMIGICRCGELLAGMVQKGGERFAKRTDLCDNT